MSAVEVESPRILSEFGWDSTLECFQLRCVNVGTLLDCVGRTHLE